MIPGCVSTSWMAVMTDSSQQHLDSGNVLVSGELAVMADVLPFYWWPSFVRNLYSVVKDMTGSDEQKCSTDGVHHVHGNNCKKDPEKLLYNINLYIL